MATVRDIINRSLRQIGVLGRGKVLSNEEADNAKEALKAMLAQFSVDGLKTYCIDTETADVTAGKAVYTIGTGGDWNITRPDRLTALVLRDSSGNDAKLSPLTTAQYAGIHNKSAGGQPYAYYYKSDYPLATVALYPVPDKNYTAHVYMMKKFEDISNLTDELEIPQVYEDMIAWNLAVRLAPEYTITPPEAVVAMAADTMRRIEVMNAEIPVLSPPPGILSGADFDIVNGTTHAF